MVVLNSGYFTLNSRRCNSRKWRYSKNRSAHKTNTIDIVNDFLKIREKHFLLVKTLFPFHITICNLQTNTIKLLNNTIIIIQCISAWKSGMRIFKFTLIDFFRQMGHRQNCQSSQDLSLQRIWASFKLSGVEFLIFSVFESPKPLSFKTSLKSLQRLAWQSHFLDFRSVHVNKRPADDKTLKKQTYHLAICIIISTMQPKFTKRRFSERLTIPPTSLSASPVEDESVRIVLLTYLSICYNQWPNKSC